MAKLKDTVEYQDAIGSRDDAASAAAGASLIALQRQILDTVGVYEGGAVTAILGALNVAAATGAVGTNKTMMAYLKQLVTEGIARDAVIGAKNTAAATGAISDEKLLMAYIKQIVTESIARDGVIGLKDTAAATGAVTDEDLIMGYIKQLVTEGIARDGVIGLKDTAAATGAISDEKLLMAYIKQIVTEGIARDAVIGLKDTAAASGAVGDEKLLMAYAKQLVTEGIARDAVVGGLTDAASDTVDVSTIVMLLRQIVEAVNNGTGAAIGENLSLVDLLGAFDGGADPQGDIFQALGVDENNSIVDLLGAFDGDADPQGDIFQALGVDENNSVKDLIDIVLAAQLPKLAKKKVDYDGSSGNGQAGVVVPLFTVTGGVKLKLYAICTDDLIEGEGDGTTEVGIVGTTDALIATTTSAAIDEGEIWHDASPDAKVELESVATEYILGDGQNVIQTITTRNITDGTIEFCVEWTPLTADGDVTPVS